MKNTSIFIIFFIVSCFTSTLQSKIRILTFHYNKPKFIKYQYKTFKKFINDDFELIVFNDASDPIIEKKISNTCKKYGIKCIRFLQEWHQTDPLNYKILEWTLNPLISSHLTKMGSDLESISKQPSIRHCHVIQYALNNFGYNYNDIVAIVDGDLFPIRNVSIKNLLNGHDMIGIKKLIGTENIEYLWVPFIAINMNANKDKEDLKFHVDVINNKIHDTGAHSYHYLINHPEIKTKSFLGHSSTSFYQMDPNEMILHGFNHSEIELTKNLPWPSCLEFHIQHHFIHFGASSFELDDSQIKENHLLRYLKKILKKE